MVLGLVAVVATVAVALAGCERSQHTREENTPPNRTKHDPDQSMSVTSLEDAAGHMSAFADRTGLTSERSPDRYLWTDAFAVCNYVGLARELDEPSYLERARRLVEQVHRTLGRHRPDDSREGWLSGLGGEEAEEHPTRGGLRIGKELPERPKDAPVDRQKEWDRDGQYFHYHTKWMHALDLLSRATGEPVYNRWARELAAAATEGFVYSEGGRPRMYWKMRIDLSEPLVPTMGHHDPLDGYVTFRQLAATADEFGADEGPSLDEEIEVFETMVEGGGWTTSDALGLGGLLLAANREAHLVDRGDAKPALLEDLLAAAASGVGHFARSGALQRTAARRLAFRELGLAIGLHAAARLEGRVGAGPALREEADPTRHLRDVTEHLDVGEEIVSFWRHPEHRETETWRDHRDINQVMLATALAPAGCLDIPGVDGSAH